MRLVIRASESFEMELTEERRAQLAHKGQVLYEKYRRLNGEDICAESFAQYHVLRGEDVVVTDFLAFLRDTLSTETDSAKIEITTDLIQRVEALL